MPHAPSPPAPPHPHRRRDRAATPSARAPAPRRASMYAAPPSARAPAPPSAPYSSLGDALGARPYGGPAATSDPRYYNTSASPTTAPGPMPAYEYAYPTHASSSAAVQQQQPPTPSPYDPQYAAGLPPMRTTSPPSRGGGAPGQYAAAAAATAATSPYASTADHWDEWAQQAQQHAHGGQAFSPNPYHPSPFSGGGVSGSHRELASPESERPFSAHYQPQPPSTSHPGGSGTRHQGGGNVSSPSGRGGRAGAGAERTGQRVNLPPADTYPKIMETYGQILGDCALVRPHTLPGRADVDRMLRSATHALQIFQVNTGVGAVPSSAAGGSNQQHRNKLNSEDTRPHPQFGTGTEMEKKSPKAARGGREDKKDSSAPEGMECLGCKATSTPEWRRGPMGPRTLCNACGLVYAKLVKKREREMREMHATPYSAAGNSQQQHHLQQQPMHPHGPYEDVGSFNSPNNNHRSDDELSYGSQEPA